MYVCILHVCDKYLKEKKLISQTVQQKLAKLKKPKIFAIWMINDFWFKNIM